jgi:hypothetical protein
MRSHPLPKQEYNIPPDVLKIASRYRASGGTLSSAKCDRSHLARWHWTRYTQVTAGSYGVRRRGWKGAMSLTHQGIKKRTSRCGGKRSWLGWRFFAFHYSGIDLTKKRPIVIDARERKKYLDLIIRPSSRKSSVSRYGFRSRAFTMMHNEEHRWTTKRLALGRGRASKVRVPQTRKYRSGGKDSPARVRVLFLRGIRVCDGILLTYNKDIILWYSSWAQDAACCRVFFLPLFILSSNPTKKGTSQFYELPGKHLRDLHNWNAAKIETSRAEGLKSRKRTHRQSQPTVRSL